jgi:hypothetical protein
VRSPEIAKESKSFAGRRTRVVRSPILGTQTLEVKKGNPSTLRVVKLRSESGLFIWEWTGGMLTNMEVRLC